jgi:hypothetical protein
MCLGSVKQTKSYSCSRSWRPLSLWDVEAPTFSGIHAYIYALRLSALEATGGLLASRCFLVSIKDLGDPRAVRLDVLAQFENPLTSSGIKFVTFRLVDYCLNELRYRVPLDLKAGERVCNTVSPRNQHVTFVQNKQYVIEGHGYRHSVATTYWHVLEFYWLYRIIVGIVARLVAHASSSWGTSLCPTSCSF